MNLMAAESRKTIFMGLQKPSDKCFLVSIPMSMYRIQTRQFTSGLNYFQKAVLKLKFMPQLSNEKIATILNLDERLVNLIVEQLESKGLITSTGNITDAGEKARNDADGLIIDGTQTQIGYVFCYDDGREVFPYYQRSINYVDVNSKELLYTSDQGVTSIEPPVDVITNTEAPNKAPHEEVILQVIKNSSYRDMEGDGDNEQITNESLQIRYIPNDQPEYVSICTYVYLPKIDDERYEDEWYVQDPFGKGDNYELKLFLKNESRHNKELANALFVNFKDVATENNRKFNESEQWFGRQVDERVNLLFDYEKFCKMDVNIQASIREVVESYMKMERNEFARITHSNRQLFFMNMQAALETILLQDQIDRAETYSDLDYNFGEYATQDDRQNCLKQVYRKMILSDTKLVPSVLLHKKTKTWKGRSLLDYLMKFIMSLAVEPDLDDCSVIKVFKNRIETIVDIANQRNHVGHGKTERDDKDSEFGGEDAKEYFEFMTELINDYSNIL